MAADPLIGTKIRRARERKRLRQQDVASQLGVSRTTYDAWENNRAYPKSSIGALEQLLEVDLSTDEPLIPPNLQRRIDALPPEDRAFVMEALTRRPAPPDEAAGEAPA